MNIDIIDNVSQLVMTIIGTIVIAVWTIRSRKTSYVLLLFFCITAILGMSYWVFFQVIVDSIPEGLDISELSWVTAYLFFLLFLEQLITPEEKRYKSKILIIPVVIGICLIIYFCSLGDYLLNIIWIGLMILISYVSLRSLLYQRINSGFTKTTSMHIFTITLIALEYFLWILSCIFPESTIWNPYYWVDFLISLSFIVLLPVARKAVET